MRSRILIGSVLFFAVIAASPAFAQDDAVGRMGGTEVGLAELRSYLDTLPAPDRAALAKDPGLMAQAVRLYLAGRLALKEAKDEKFDQKPDVKAGLDRARDTALIDLYLQSEAKVPDGYPSEAELETAYEANKASFIAPRRMHLAQIFIAAPRGSTSSAKLGEVTGKLKAKRADFSALARDYSDNAAEAVKSGEIGWLAEPRLIPAIARALSNLAPGAVSDPIRLEDGWHIVKLLETKAGGEQLALSEVKKPLTEQMRRQRALELRQAYLADLMRRTPPVLNELALSRLNQ